MTDSSEYDQVVQIARGAFCSGVTKNVHFRVQQLENLYKMIYQNEELIVSAIMEDLQRSKAEAVLSSIESVLSSIRYAKQNIRKWVSRECVEKCAYAIPYRLFIQKEPLGLVLVIGAWNFPVLQTVIPMIGAIAAGNCVILKPSHITAKTSDVLKSLIPRYLDQMCYHVVTAGPEGITDLLKHRFDHILYTGSMEVGQKVRAAANMHLTPVTLELGGKSPAYMDDSANLEIACRRLIWSKFLNGGQTCVSSDYLMCSKEVQDKLIPLMKEILKKFYGEIPQSSPAFPPIIHEKSFSRLLYLMNSGDIVIGGEVDAKTRYMAPTVIINVKLTDPIMQEEIFGPLLPIITVEGSDEAINIINSREKPLTLNVYSTRKDVIKKFLKGTSSGSVCINDAIVNLGVETLPFGGVGKSGMGCYRGKFSFDTFSHKKPVIIGNYSKLIEKVSAARYPPYTDVTLILGRALIRLNIYLPNINYVLIFLCGFAVAFIVKGILHFLGAGYF